MLNDVTLYAAVSPVLLTVTVYYNVESPKKREKKEFGEDLSLKKRKSA